MIRLLKFSWLRAAAESESISSILEGKKISEQLRTHFSPLRMTRSGEIEETSS